MTEKNQIDPESGVKYSERPIRPANIWSQTIFYGLFITTCMILSSLKIISVNIIIFLVAFGIYFILSMIMLFSRSGVTILFQPVIRSITILCIAIIYIFCAQFTFWFTGIIALPIVSITIWIMKCNVAFLRENRKFISILSYVGSISLMILAIVLVATGLLFNPVCWIVFLCLCIIFGSLEMAECITWIEYPDDCEFYANSYGADNMEGFLSTVFIMSILNVFYSIMELLTKILYKRDHRGEGWSYNSDNIFSNMFGDCSCGCCSMENFNCGSLCELFFDGILYSCEFICNILGYILKFLGYILECLGSLDPDR